MSFTRQLRAIATKRKESMRQVAVRSVLQVSTSVIKETPVEEGTLRGNWNPQIGTPDTSTDYSKTMSPITSITSECFRMKLGDKFYLTNSMPYAEPIEYGHSRVKAPLGMVRISVALWQQIVAKQVRNQR